VLLSHYRTGIALVGLFSVIAVISAVLCSVLCCVAVLLCCITINIMFSYGMIYEKRALCARNSIVSEVLKMGTRPLFERKVYSYLSASIGFNLEARHAG